MTPTNDQDFNKELRLPEEHVAGQINELKVRCNEIDSRIKRLQEDLDRWRFHTSRMHDLTLDGMAGDKKYNRILSLSMTGMAVINIFLVLHQLF